MNKILNHILQTLFFCIVAAAIPFLLILNARQAEKYRDLKNEIISLEKKQEDLINENKKLISDISILSSADRIEKIAEEDLGMKKADSEDIIRLEVNK
jgi:cell division protein FtsL